jgi:energy-coupling factor transporter transmembrane protein EcfT
MMRLGGRRSVRRPQLVENSPLRGFDPRVKLFIGLGASFALMLPLERLAIYLAVYALLLAWARLLPAAARQFWRLKWALLFLFLVDWLVVDSLHAATVAMRIILLAGMLSLIFATTTPTEFSLALEKLGAPYRYAFSLSLAFSSLNLLEEELQAIREAQAARGVKLEYRGLRQAFQQAGEWVALAVPAIVLTTRRAWSINEAAYARGFDSPHRRPYRTLHLSLADLLLLGGAIGLIAILWLWK